MGTIYLLLIVMAIFIIVIIYLLMKQQGLRKTNEKLHKNLEIAKNKEQSLKLDTVLPVIAHDLKNPLSTYISLSTYLVNNFETLDNAELKEYLTMQQSSSQKMYKLLNDLLNWARAGSGKTKMNKEISRIKDLILYATEYFEAELQNKKITLETAVKGNIFLLIDRNMILTVIRNILSNAIKFSHQHSKIQLKSYSKGDYHIISIKDYGVGISQNNIMHLFDFDITKSTAGTAGESGTGMGLSVAYEFVKLHGGTIEVESQENEGTTFLIKLPLEISSDKNNLEY